MPKTGTLVVRTRHMHCVPAPLALRGFGSGFDSSRAQNPDPQQLRRRFFMPKNRGTSTHKCAFCYFSHPGLARPVKA